MSCDNYVKLVYARLFAGISRPCFTGPSVLEFRSLCPIEIKGREFQCIRSGIELVSREYATCVTCNSGTNSYDNGIQVLPNTIPITLTYSTEIIFNVLNVTDRTIIIPKDGIIGSVVILESPRISLVADQFDITDAEEEEEDEVDFSESTESTTASSAITSNEV